MSIIWQRPVVDTCLPTTWHRPYTLFSDTSPQACPDLLLIGCDFSGVYGVPRLKVNMGGRGWHGDNCPFTDPYVRLILGGEVWQEVSGASYEVFGIQLIDVWGALRDGVWTSSVDIETRVTASTAVSVTMYVHARNGTDNYVTKSITSEGSGAFSCGSALKATITVNDDGTFSIA